jgi:FAD synthetase
LYGIKIQLFSADFKAEVQKLIDTSNVKAIIMGNRRSDPWSRDLESVCKSSPGWPEFMRVFPILDWSYQEVWQFLRTFEQPYCSLYDEGYTSLGEQDNTINNPFLKVEEPDGNIRYLPAYML